MYVNFSFFSLDRGDAAIRRHLLVDALLLIRPIFIFGRDVVGPRLLEI